VREARLTARRRLFSLKQRPSTFAEAGVVAPFTTPLLVQARMRLDYRGRLEIVARNPTGADGMYVVPLAALNELYRLSLHDRALVERMQGLTPVSPLGIREIALSLSREGLAGPDAEAAAARSLQEEEERSLLTMLLLLEQLLQEADLGKIDWKNIDTGSSDARERLRPYFKSLEPSMGIASGELITMLDELSGLVASIGHTKAPFKSLSDTTLEEVVELRRSIAEWVRGERDDHAILAGLVVECATLTIDCTGPGLAKAKTIANSARRLLHARASDRQKVDDVLTRPIWLLDGWRHLAALWRGGAEEPREAQRDILVELAELAPLVPLAADEWLGKPMEVRGNPELRRWVRLNEDWRTGHVLDRQAVIEQVLAEAL
jgi:hypothetical protein